MKKFNKRYWIYGIIILIAAFWCKRFFLVKPTPKHSLVLSVVTGKPYKASLHRYVNAVGQTVASEAVTLVPQIEGELIHVFHKNGGLVKAGELLFEIKSSSYKAQLKQAEAQLTIDKAFLQLHQSKLQRSEALRHGDYVSKQEYDTYKANVQEYEGRVALDEAACTLKQLDLDHCFIRAPFAGNLNKSKVNEYSFVTKGSALATLNQIQPIYVDFSLSEKYRSDIIQALNKQKEGIVVCAYSLDNKEINQTGRLIAIDNEIDTLTGSFSLRAEFKNDNGIFGAGQGVDLKINYDLLKDVWLVPESALHVSNDGQFVYVINAEQKAEMRSVKTGQVYQNWVVVYEGIQGDEQIIALGHPLLAPGASVVSAQQLPEPKNLDK